MKRRFPEYIDNQQVLLDGAAGTADEHVLYSSRQTRVTVDDRPSMLNFCSNNYLALANHFAARRAAMDAIDQYGYSLTSVGSTCGSHRPHKSLESEVATLLCTDALNRVPVELR